MSTYQFARRLWHLVPDSVREATRSSRAVRTLKGFFTPTHDDLYDMEYYRGVDAATVKSAPTIVGSIVRDLGPKTLLDVGRGSGAMLDECRRQGIRGRGVERGDGGLADNVMVFRRGLA